MEVILHLEPGVEAGLVAQAQASGMGLDDYLVSLIEKAVAHQPVGLGASTENSRKDAVDRMLEFGEKYRLSLGEPITRELLHDEHRF